MAGLTVSAVGSRTVPRQQGGHTPQGGPSISKRSDAKKSAQPSQGKPYCSAGEQALGQKRPVKPARCSCGRKKSSACMAGRHMHA